MNDAIARDRELFSRIAETHPGIVRTLDVLIGELDAADLDPETLRQLGDRVRRIGNKLTEHADHVIIDLEPRVTIRTNVFDTWTELVDIYRSPRAARVRLRELGVGEDTLTRLSAITGDLHKIRKARGARDHAKRDAHIVSALALGAPRDDVSQAAGVTIDRLRQIWRDAGYAGRPWNDTPAAWEFMTGHSSRRTAEMAPWPPRPARFLDAWEALKRSHAGQRGAARALLDLGVPEASVQHFKDVDKALQNVYNLTGDTRRRDNAIVKAVALGVPLDTVGMSAGITRERVRQIWKNSGRTDKPWRAPGPG